ncbi:mating locus regulatory protein [Scheffersomyces stipitis CBS 6054]|uniref:Mating locus regulatory protein n=1 Tax=Scheffersomyces stipitis (strain ATCC 58785 / CBS 6054 / NBRC 10063 / NRRL Y-11545) TaxID=322104 RepID=A3LZ96_PICST|nr:mating locus regulatory protein [Scheffersomyces stipitis CBS 6054]ABN68300.2 mating locus regulatory protein [Scheffersomyces stipitis CBS 6054]KAG2734622.1 hypothetical protein G9P44_002628 [Scheffersomyces stipitis]
MSSSFSFSFPKVNRGTSTGSSVKQLACASSFPLVSTNSSKRDSDFLTHENPSSLLKKSRSRNDTFRSRNSFIVARNIITNLMPSDLKTFRDLAKTVSSIWKKSPRQFQEYFQYLSLVEASWYEKSTGTIRSAPPAFKHSEYRQLCRSSYYTKSKRDSAPKQSADSFKDKFRVTKVKRERNKGRSQTGAFKIKTSSVNCSLGIFTEDMYK